MQPNQTTGLELGRIIRNRKIPNALLFSGPINSGRKEAAFWFVKACNCLQPEPTEKIACDQCRSCRKINAGTHPDIHFIQAAPQKKQISIAQIREAGTILTTKPNESRYRMVLIRDAHMMNVQAQNALLKMLEEPPERTFFILITHQDLILLPTIHSRCRTFAFKPATDPKKIQEIAKNNGVDPQLAQIALITAQNDLQKTMLYLNLTESEESCHWIEKRDWLLRELFDLITMVPRDLESAMQKSMAISWRISREPVLVPDMMAIIKTFIRDISIFVHAPERIVNLDFFDQFKDISEQLSRNMISKWTTALFETEKKLSGNCALQLTLDSFFLKFVTTTE